MNIMFKQTWGLYTLFNSAVELSRYLHYSDIFIINYTGMYRDSNISTIAQLEYVWNVYHIRDSAQ